LRQQIGVVSQEPVINQNRQKRKIILIIILNSVDFSIRLYSTRPFEKTFATEWKKPQMRFVSFSFLSFISFFHFFLLFPSCFSSLQDIIAAAKSAEIHEFIVNSLPQGYDTVVGERGVRMSGEKIASSLSFSCSHLE
jgi:ABC-type multidrug transport system fused ATPase/permease subunit